MIGCPWTDPVTQLEGLGNVYESDGGAAFIIDGCAHVAFVGAL